MTDKECIALLKEKMADENAPGAMLGGTGIKYDYHITESGKPIFSMYIPEIQTLFFPIENKEGIWDNYEVVRHVKNFDIAMDLSLVHYNK